MTKTIDEIKAYISELNSKYKEGITTEHSFRGALETLLKNLTGLTVVNEAKHIDCGAPDLTLLQKNIPVGYVEAKDIGKNINSKDYKNQFDRYKKALDNLIITDYVTFQLFEDEYLVTEIAIGKILPNKIEPLPENYNAFAEMIKTFSLYNGKAIKDSQKLAEYMAAKTQLLAEVIEKAIADKDENNSLRQQLKGFQQVLLPTMTDIQFADIYAQTIAYGMFVARLQDSSNDNFTRQHAATLIPLSNPFLRNLFQYIAGFGLDENIKWIVDSLADMFNYVDVADIHKEFESKDKDPFLHFYKDFLTKYDKNLKNARGVYYTPSAVVKFIVNAIDDILKSDFDISNGLADTSMVEQFHKIQILDPATGTGSPTYRERYKEFLKIDFPRVPYPENAEQFSRLATLGGKLRRLHLMEGVEPQSGMADFPIADSNEVENPQFIENKVFINDTQYFDNVPLVAWNFYIGGYQPSQKWLKDRKGQTLGYDEIRHYHG